MKGLIAAVILMSGAWSSFLASWITWQLVVSGAFEEPRFTTTPAQHQVVRASDVAPGEVVTTDSKAAAVPGPTPAVKVSAKRSAALAAFQAQAKFQSPVVEFELPKPGETWTGEMIFKTRCIVCHSLEVPKAQKLDRSTWSWVVGEMQKKYHVPLSDEEKVVLLDYVTSSYGPGTSK